MRKFIQASLLTVAALASAACTPRSDEGEAFTGPIKPTDAVPIPVENLCPIEMRTGCVKFYAAKGAEIPGRVGEVSADVRTISSGRGVFLNAPTATLAPGRYALKFDYDYSPTPTAKPVRWDLIYISDDRKIVTTDDGLLPAGSNLFEIQLDLDVARRQYQFRIHFEDSGKLTAKSLAITPQDAVLQP